MSNPRILLAPDKFKGSLSAAQVCDLATEELAEIWPEATFDRCPVADGGDGTCAAVADSRPWDWVGCSAHDALGRSLTARYLYDASDRIALLEMSAASGLVLVSDQPLDPRRASTFGTGELLLDAIRRGARRVVVGLGGSATNDGGAGLAEALGWEFRNVEGDRMEGLPQALEQLETLTPPTDPISGEVQIVAACDVDNPLLGKEGAIPVYGPQKGVAEGDYNFFENRLSRLAERVGGQLHEIPGAGAAGGLGFGLMAFAGASLQPGFDLVADLLQLEGRLAEADLVVVGEGSFDSQTMDHGKGPARLLAMAQEKGVPVLVLCGIAEREAEFKSGACVVSCAGAGLSVEESMGNAAGVLVGEIRRNASRIQSLLE